MSQVTCSDDGAPPDRAKNDEVSTCSGPAPGVDLGLRLRTPEVELTARASWPEGSDLLQGRWTAGGLEIAEWSLSEAAAPQEPEASEVLDQALEALQESARAESSPAGPPGGSDRGGWVAMLLLAGGAFLLWRGRRPPSDIPHVTRVAGESPQVRTLERWSEAATSEVAALSGSGAVLVLAPPDQGLPTGQPGPVLRAESADVLDLLDTLEALLRRDPLLPPALVVTLPLLAHPDGLGVPAIEHLEAKLPPGVRLLKIS